MKYFILLTLSLNLYAKLPIASIEGFSGQYSDPSGQAQAQQFSYEDIDFGASPIFTVEKQASTLHLITPTDEYSLESIPESVSELENLSWSELNLNSSPESINLSLGQMDGKNIDEEMKIVDFSLECKGQDNYESVKEDALDSCINNFGRISFKSFESIKEGKKNRISQFLVKSNKNKLYMNLRVSGHFLKIYGKIFYEENQIRVKVSKVKKGILSVTGLLFKELNKIESSSLEVKRPWITIKLSK